ncbi:hypothetical protein HK096_010872, partial [Nowakowskiella sp. JEL0078]
VVDHTLQQAEMHRNFSNILNNNILDPFLLVLRDMENHRKSVIDRGSEYFRIVQEYQQNLRKAKKEHDNLVTQHVDLCSSLMKAQNASKEKEIDKLNLKVNAMGEKLKIASESLIMFEDTYRTAENDYNLHLIPGLSEELRNKEEERSLANKKLMLDFNQLEQQMIADSLKNGEIVGDIIKGIDVSDDMEKFSDNHMSNPDGRSKISAQSLVNPIKVGKIYMKRGDIVSGWKLKYFVLANLGSKTLFCFDSEDSQYPRDIIPLQNSQVENLDDSFFNRANCLQIISRAPQINISANGGSIAGSGVKQTFNLSTESLRERDEWVIVLRYHTTCCVKCESVFGPKGTQAEKEVHFSNSQQSGLSANMQSPNSESELKSYIDIQPGLKGYPATDIFRFRSIKSVKLNIIEAKDLPYPGGFSGTNDGGLLPYCVCLLDDVKMARTVHANGNNPFWGEVFSFKDISLHHNRLRILLLNTGRMQKDVDIGHISINLQALKPNKTVEEWFPLKIFSKNNHDDDIDRRNGSVRLGVTLVSNNSIHIRAV